MRESIMKDNFFLLFKVFEIKANNNKRKEKFSPYLCFLAVGLFKPCRVKIKEDQRYLKEIYLYFPFWWAGESSDKGLSIVRRINQDKQTELIPVMK